MHARLFPFNLTEGKNVIGLYFLSVIILIWKVDVYCASFCPISILSIYLFPIKISPLWQVLSVLMLSDYIPGSITSILEGAFNRNLLGAFLLVNKIPYVIVFSLSSSK